MRIRIFVIAMLVLASPVHAQASDGKAALIDTLLEQTGQSVATMAGQFSQLFSQKISQQLRAVDASLPPAAFALVDEEVNAVIYEQLIANDGYASAIRQIYAAQFTEAQLASLLAFYNTDLGKALLAASPQISAQTNQLGRDYGTKLSADIRQRVSQRLRAEGLR